jgi:hypothetical protein
MRNLLLEYCPHRPYSNVLLVKLCISDKRKSASYGVENSLVNIIYNGAANQKNKLINFTYKTYFQKELEQ